MPQNRTQEAPKNATWQGGAKKRNLAGWGHHRPTPETVISVISVIGGFCGLRRVGGTKQEITEITVSRVGLACAILRGRRQKKRDYAGRRQKT